MHLKPGSAFEPELRCMSLYPSRGRRAVFLCQGDSCVDWRSHRRTRTHDQGVYRWGARKRPLGQTPRRCSHCRAGGGIAGYCQEPRSMLLRDAGC